MPRAMRKLILFMLIVFVAASLLPSHPVRAANLVVTRTADDTSNGSLRWAINQANASSGADTITFNISTNDPGYQASGSYWRITLSSGLPQLTGGDITIDGTDAGNRPTIEIRGGVQGLFVKSSGNTIRGLIINSIGTGFDEDGPFGVGIVISGFEGATANNNVVEYCYLGTNYNGTVSVANQDGGLAIVYGASNNTIRNNVISGNGDEGIYVGAGERSTDSAQVIGNVIENNIVGLNAAGNAVLGNSSHGIEIFDNAVNTRVGPGNVISGNGTGSTLNPHYGVKIVGDLRSNSTPISGNIVVGNRIGTNASGTGSIPNRAGGVLVGTSQGTQIGGSGGNRNIISGNGGFGVIVDDNEPNVNGARSGIVITNNWIGLNAAGTGAIENSGEGVVLECGATGVVVGPDNVISGQVSSGGIRVRNQGATTCSGTTQNNEIIGNRIGTNPNGDQPAASNPFGNFFGIIIEKGATNNTIGGPGANDGNLISGNEFFGIGLGQPGSSDNANNNVVQGNRVEFNSLTTNTGGIVVRNQVRNNRITRTSTTGNGGPGIDLLTNGNNNIAAPNITNATVTGAPPNLTLNVAINVGGVNCGTNECAVEVFDSSNRENEEGPNFLTSFNIAGTDSYEVPLTACRSYLTFTLTDPSGNTSPFTNAFGPFAQCNAQPTTYGVAFGPNRAGGPVAPGSAVDYVHTLRNTGNVEDTFTLAGNSSTAGVTFVFTPGASVTLAAGASTQVTVRVNLPAGVSSNQVVSTVTATSQGDPTKQASATQTTQIVTTPQPELTPATRSGEGRPGQQVTYEHTLRNVGNGSGTFSVAVSGLPNGWNAQLSPSAPVTLAPNATANVRLTVTIPAGAAAGTTAVATITASASEGGTPVTARDTTTVLLAPALAFAPVPPQNRDAGPGQTLAYQYQLTNNGNGQDTFTIAVTPPADWNASVEPSTSITLERDQSQVVTVQLTVPSGVSVGTYPMTVQATSTSDTSVTTSVNSVTTVVSAAVPQISIEAGQRTDPGSPVTFNHTVTNVGNEDGAFNLSIQQAPAGWTVTPSVPSVGPLPPTQSAPVSVAVTPPADALAGDYTFLLQAQATDSNAATATVADTVTINRIADLALAPPLQQSTEPPASVVSYTFTLENNGNFDDTINLSAVSSQGWQINRAPAGPLTIPARTSQQVTIGITIPPGQVAGLIDTTTLTATSSEASVQATAQAETTIAAVPGVQLSPSVIAETGLSAEPITFTFSLLNSGSIPQSYGLSLADVPTTPGWSSSVTPETTPELAPGQAISVEVVLQAPEETEKSTFPITLQAVSSPDGATDDATIQFTVGARLDVEIGPEEVTGGGWNAPVRYTFNVTNTGLLSETFALEANSFLGWETFAPTEITLEPDEIRTIIIAVVVPFSAASGSEDTTIVTVRSQTDAEVFDQATAKTRVTQTAGLSFTPNDIRPPVPGQEIRFQHTLVNIGNGLDSFVISVTQELDWPVTFEPAVTPALRRGGSFPVEVRIQVPADASPFVFNRIVVRATSELNSDTSAEVIDIISRVFRFERSQVIYLPIAGRSVPSQPLDNRQNR